jgi:hypothetical protein
LLAKDHIYDLAVRRLMLPVHDQAEIFDLVALRLLGDFLDLSVASVLSNTDNYSTASGCPLNLSCVSQA